MTIERRQDLLVQGLYVGSMSSYEIMAAGECARLQALISNISTKVAHRQTARSNLFILWRFYPKANPLAAETAKTINSTT